MNIEDLYDLNVASDSFGAVLWVWSLCPSAGISPLEAIAFPTASTNLSLGEIKSVPVKGGRQYSYRRIQGTFRHNWGMDNYPFGWQRLVIPIDETHYGASRLIFEPDTAASFLTPDIRTRLGQWEISDLILTTSVSEEASSYGLPDVQGARYARAEASMVVEQKPLLPFLKLTAGVFAGMFIAFLCLFFDPNERVNFVNRLTIIALVLFSIILSLRAADAGIGHFGSLTMITNIHFVALGFLIVIALLALREQRAAESGSQVRYPHWPLVGLACGLYILVNVVLIGRAALPYWITSH